MFKEQNYIIPRNIATIVSWWSQCPVIVAFLSTVHTLSMSHQKYVQVMYTLMIFFKGTTLRLLVHTVVYETQWKIHF